MRAPARLLVTLICVFHFSLIVSVVFKASFKNISMKNAPKSSIDYVVLVQGRAAETAGYSSYKGTQKLQALRFGEHVEVDKSTIGHLPGVSDRHKDRRVGRLS
jgi:hypothetical protein